jgi:hypothetical protein
VAATETESSVGTWGKSTKLQETTPNYPAEQFNLQNPTNLDLGTFDNIAMVTEPSRVHLNAGFLRFVSERNLYREFRSGTQAPNNPCCFSERDKE